MQNDSLSTISSCHLQLSGFPHCRLVLLTVSYITKFLSLMCLQAIRVIFYDLLLLLLTRDYRLIQPLSTYV
jgi:hypothetical protein